MSQPDSPALNVPDAAERYVAGRMSEDEEQQFEVEMLETPDLAAEVDVRQRMKLGLRHLERQGKLQALLSARSPPRWLPFALAAGVLLVVLGAAAYWRFGGVQDPVPAALTASAGSHVAASASYLLASTRGGAVEPTLEVSRNAAPLRLRIIPELQAAASFSVSLAQLVPSGETAASQPVTLEEGTAGFVEVFLDPSKLSSGRYRLRLTPDPGGSGEDYFFTLRIAP